MPSSLFRPTGKQWNPNFPNSATELNQNRSVLPIWVNNDSNVVPSDENVVYLSTGAVKTILNVIGAVYSTSLVGKVEQFIGNARTTTVDFPYLCMTNFSGSKALALANYEDLVPHLRAQTLVYLEGQAGEATSFSGSVAGSVLTLDDNAANNAIIAALEEDRLAFGGSFTDWRTVDINTVTFAITAIDVGTRTITVTGTPSAGSQEAQFYPHRIAGSTTTARVHSWVGRVLTAAGTGEVIAGLLRRDRFQAWQIGSTFASTDYYGQIVEDVGSIGINAGSGAGRPSYTNASQGSAALLTAFNDGTNDEPRTGSDTHGPDVGLHQYVYVGRYRA